MAVYPICTECHTRRDKCPTQSAHKRAVRWTVDVQFTRTSPRVRKTFDTKELADIKERQLHADYDRGLLVTQREDAPSFTQVADEWWVNEAIGKNRIQNPNVSEKYRVEMFKALFGDRPINMISFKDADEWITKRVPGYAINTINRDVRPLKWIMNYAVKRRYITASPFLDLKDLKGGNVRVRWMTEAEINLLIQAAMRLEDMTLIDVIEVGVNTGFRKGNLERLAARDIGEIRIAAVKTKSGNPYDVPKSPAIIPLLDRLIVSHPTGPLLDTMNLDERFRRAAKLAGLYSATEEKVTIHTLRHTFAALYLKRGGDLYKLSKLMGHSSIRVTEQTYGHICPKELDAQAPLISTMISRVIDLKVA